MRDDRVEGTESSDEGEDALKSNGAKSESNEELPLRDPSS